MVNTLTPPSPEALFRYLVVASVRALELRGAPRTVAVRDVAAEAHPFGPSLRTVSKRTLWRWLAAWDGGSLVGLEPAARQSPGSRALSPALIAFLMAEKTEDPDASVPELVERARETGVLHPTERVDRTTVWRMLVRRGVATSHRQPPKGRDSRRWAYRERMQLVMVDFKQFRAGPTRARRAALYLLDDATRFGLGVWVTTIGETGDDVLRGLAEVIRIYGLMSVLYWDLGSGFRDGDVGSVLAQLDIAPIFGTAGYPQARGKIERFNRSAQARILRSLVRDDVDSSLPALQLRLRHDLREVYNHRPHESLGKRTPHEVFFASERPLRAAPSEDWLRQCFTVPVERTVSADHVITFGGELWEAPR
ncbi:MAG: putative transposase, partial [Myxococcota bacterium]